MFFNPLAHLKRIALASLGSDLIPAKLRTRLIRWLGGRAATSACIWPGCNLLSLDLDLGEHVFINVGFFFDGADTLTIERDVRIGQFVRVITASHEIGPSNQRCRIEAVSAPVRIEAGSWIGANVTILPGVTIRSGCVIGVGAVVMSDTEPDGLYVGTPARRIRDLPSG